MIRLHTFATSRNSVKRIRQLDNITVTVIIAVAAAVCDIYGDRGNPARKHVNCYDG